MAPPKVDEKSCNINCNYLGGSSEQICAQLDEFNQGLESPLVSVAADPLDDNYCAYQSVASREIIKPVAFQNGYYLLKGTVWAEGDYLYFRMGEVPKEVEEKFRARLAESESGYQIAVYHVLVKNDSGFAPPEDAYQLEETAIRYLNTEFGSEIIDYYSIPTGKGNGRLEYRLYVAGYNLPEAFPQSLEKESRPPLKFDHCPEWVQHQSQVRSEIPIAGWALTQRPQGKLLAIPREELKGEIGSRLNAAEQYAYDLCSRLGLSEYMKGDNPIRLLKEVQFVGDSGVVGLACPRFEVTIDEIAKREDNCLEWVERKKRSEIERGGKVITHQDGFLMTPAPGIFKYIVARGKSDLNGVKKEVARLNPDREGFVERVEARPPVVDLVCSAYELRVGYERIPQPSARTSALPPGIGDKEKLLTRFEDNPRVQKKIGLLGELGEITWAPPVGREPGQGADLITVIKRKIHEEEKRPRLEVMLAVDGSGSMKNDTRFVRDKLEDLVGEMKSSADEGGMGLLGFVDDESPLLVSLDPAKPLEAYIPDMKAGLTHIDRKMDGGIEYIYEAARKTLDHLERSGKKGSVQKILLLTDEEGNIKDKGETLASIRQRADRLGVKFEIIFIADAGGMDGLQIFLQYLDMAWINPGAMAKEERMKLWEKMLKDPSLDGGVKKIVCEKVAQEKHAGSPQILAQALKDSEWHVRQAAAESLGKLGDPRGVPALHEALKDSDWAVRQAAAESLGRIGTSDVIPHLSPLFFDPNSEVIQAATEAIEAIQVRGGLSRKVRSPSNVRGNK